MKKLKLLYKDVLISQIKIEEKDIEKLSNDFQYKDDKLVTVIKRSLEDYKEIEKFFETN